MRFAIAGKWEFAAIAILVAAVLDALDGTIARLLKAASDFGAELDSLSDVVAFGVAPGLIIYFWSLSTIGGFGWAAALFFAVCCALRLARFNSTLETRPAYAYNFFTGRAGARRCAPRPIAAGDEPGIRRRVLQSSRFNRTVDRCRCFADGKSGSDIFVETVKSTAANGGADARPYRLIGGGNCGCSVAYYDDRQPCLSW